MKCFSAWNTALCAAVSISLCSALFAADGVWTNTVGGNWSNTANWQAGAVAGSGGTATINLTGADFTINNDLGTVSLAGITLNASVGGRTVFISGGTNELVAPAVLKTSDTSFLSFSGSKLSSSSGTDLLITGLGRLFLGSNNLLAGRTIISNGNVRAISDSAFGPAPGVLDADAIILDGGNLMNDANGINLTISPNRGITLTAAGGYLSAGYNAAGTAVNSPITGAGFLGINYEFSKVYLGSSANDYAGGTRIGTLGPGVNAGQSAVLVLNANEVLPDAGGLIIGGESHLTNTLPAAILDLNGKTESVDTLSSGARAQITSSIADQGRLIIGSQNDDSDYSGTLTGGATIEKKGAGNLNLSAASLTAAGTLDLRGGAVQAGGPNLGYTTLLLNGAELEIVAPAEPHELAAGADNVMTARILLETNTTLTVDSNAGSFVFAGIVTTNSVQIPEPTLTIDNGGAPVPFGSADPLAPAVLDADIASAGGLTLTNNVWLRRLPSAAYTRTDGVNLFLDGSDLLGGALVLSNYSATIVANTTIGGGGSATVLNGNTLSFSTMQFVDKALQDAPGNTLNLSNNLFLTDSSVVFTGEGSITYGGDFTGSGTVEKQGSGTTELTGTGSALTGDIVISGGTLVAGSETVLGGASVTLAGGFLSNKEGNDLTLSTTEFSAQSGGFNVTPGETMTVNTQVTGIGPVSKTGAGTLILGGSEMNSNLNLTVSSGVLQLNKTGAADTYAVRTLAVAGGATATLTGSSGNQIGGDVTLSGGTLDLNGLSESLGRLNSADRSSLVVNNGAAAGLSVGEGDSDSDFKGALSDGTGALTLTKVGAGTMTLAVETIAYSGGTAVEAGTLRLMPALLPAVAGLAYQLDAVNPATITLNGTKVSAWRDSSAAGVNFSQGTVAQQPEYVKNAINGLPAVRFSDSARNRMTGSKAATAQTVFIVARTTSFGGLDGIWGRSGTDYGIRGKSLGAWQDRTNGGNDGDFTFSGDLYIDGVLRNTYYPAQPYILTATRNAPDTNTHAIGDYWNNGTYLRYFRGYVGEVLVYNRALSAAERAAVENYLKEKWLGGGLPSGLSYRLDASDPSTISRNGSKVTAWADTTASGVNFAQGTAAQQPDYVENAINGLPAVQFGISGSTRLVASKSATARTVFIVSKKIADQSLAGVWGESGQDRGARHANATSWRHTGNSADVNDFTFNGVMRINGVPGFSWGSQPLHIMTGVSTADKNWTAAIGNYWAASSGATRFLRGYIGEILVYNRALSTAELERVEAYLAQKWMGAAAAPAAETAITPVTVDSGATLAVNGNGIRIGTLSGAGDLAVESGSVAITNYTGFTGAVFGAGTLALAAADGADATLTPRSLSVTIRNDGAVAADLVVDGTGTNLFMGSMQDGESALGFVHSGSGTTLMTGLSSTYTGATVIEAGVASVGGAVYAKYLRFFPQMTRTSGDHQGTGYQISEFQMMFNGAQLLYPAGTLATSFGKVAGAEGPEKAIDGSVDTKFYTDIRNPSYPLVVELPEPVLFDGYRWYTANDATGRDPVKWSVDVSYDGVSWITVDLRDYSASQTAVTTARKTLVGAWTMSAGGSMNVLSDLSAATVAAPAELAIVAVSETVGALSGDGLIRLSNGTLGINAFTNATFTGDITGSGTIVKKGDANQALSGALSVSGTIIVEAGVLDLTGAVLTGITNIVIQSGGELTGSATVNGDLTVTFEGGSYSGTLTVTGALTTSGTVVLAKPEGQSYPLNQLLFTYASADQATQDALVNATLPSPLPPGYIANVRVTATSARLVAAPAGLLIILK